MPLYPYLKYQNYGNLKILSGGEVVIRSKDTSDMSEFYDMGAKYVVAETLESSLRIARLMMEEAGIENTEIEKTIKKSWEQNCILLSLK